MLGLACVEETDEILVTSGQPDTLGRPLDDDWVEDLLGNWISYGWDLRNHRGYLDAFQLRLVDLTTDERDEVAVQFEVMASTIHVRRVDTR